MSDASDNEDRPTLKKRFESHPIPFVIGLCAAVAVGVAGLSAYVTRNALSLQELELTTTLRKEKHQELGEQRQRLLATIKERNSEIVRLKETLKGLDDENETLRRATMTFLNCGEQEKCRDFFIHGLIRPVDVDDIIATRNVVRIENSRVFAPRFPDSEIRYLRRAYGELHRFQLDASFDLEARERDTTDASSQHIWFIGPPVRIEGHRQLQRFAPHFSVHRQYILKGRREDSIDPVFNAFNVDLAVRNTDKNYRFMRPRIRQIESLRNEALFAHYQTVLRDVVVDGQPKKRVFLNEMIFYVQARDGSPDVFVIRCAFLSDGRHIEASPDWGRVMAWWSQLVIQA